MKPTPLLDLKKFKRNRAETLYRYGWRRMVLRYKTEYFAHQRLKKYTTYCSTPPFPSAVFSSNVHTILFANRGARATSSRIITVDQNFLYICVTETSIDLSSSNDLLLNIWKSRNFYSGCSSCRQCSTSKFFKIPALFPQFQDFVSETALQSIYLAVDFLNHTSGNTYNQTTSDIETSGEGYIDGGLIDKNNLKIIALAQAVFGRVSWTLVWFPLTFAHGLLRYYYLFSPYLPVYTELFKPIRHNSFFGEYNLSV